MLLMFFLSCSDALAACNYLPQSREKIIAALFKALNSTNNELQEAGEACMRKVSATSLVRFLLLCNWFRFGFLMIYIPNPSAVEIFWDAAF